MQDADLFLELAGIAGVFVGFGALIAVRSGGASGRQEIGYTRGMVSSGVLTVVAALAPVTIARYGLTGHQIWVLSSIVALTGLLVTTAAMARTPEYRANWAAEIEAARTGSRPRWFVIADRVTTMLWSLAVLLIPIIIMLGVAPELEAALFSTLVELFLLLAAWLLLALVYVQRLPESA